MGSTSQESPLDEIQWSHPGFIAAWGPLHTNTVLPYFADSPWFDRTSNNGTLMAQALYNPALHQVVGTRQTFEERLESMSGLEYRVAQEPAETGPGQGTGVWVIRKQTRKKRPGQEDEITVHSDYYIVGENVYAAPTFADLMSSRLATMSHAIDKIFESANSIQKWTPARGHAYANPTVPRAATLEPKDATPMPDGPGNRPGQMATKSSTKAELDARLAEESFFIHKRFGSDYMDEIPITGKPGDFHFASTGRNDKLAVPQAQNQTLKPPVLAPLNTEAVESIPPKDLKKTKSPKPGGQGKSKQRKGSKGGSGLTTGTTTPS